MGHIKRKFQAQTDLQKTIYNTKTTMLTVLKSLHTKLSFSLRISSVSVTNSVIPADLVTFTEEILNGYFIFCSVSFTKQLNVAIF